MNHVERNDNLDEMVRHRDYLYKFAVYRVRDPHLADDLVQETLLAALKSGSDYEGRSTYKVWLTGILKHKMMDAFRERSRYVSIDNENLEGVDWLENETSAHRADNVAESLISNPSKSIELTRLLSSVDCALRAMPAGVSDVFYAREIEGESSDEISSRMGISVDNVWVRVHRARKAIQAHLKKSGVNPASGTVQVMA